MHFALINDVPFNLLQSSISGNLLQHESMVVLKKCHINSIFSCVHSESEKVFIWVRFFRLRLFEKLEPEPVSLMMEYYHGRHSNKIDP